MGDTTGSTGWLNRLLAQPLLLILLLLVAGLSVVLVGLVTYLLWGGASASPVPTSTPVVQFATPTSLVAATPTTCWAKGGCEYSRLSDRTRTPSSKESPASKKSRTANSPPGRSTRWTSENPAPRSDQFRTPKPHNAASKTLSGKGSRRASPQRTP